MTTEYIAIPYGLSLLAFSHQFPVSVEIAQSFDRTIYELSLSHKYTIRDNPLRHYNFNVHGTVADMYALFLTFADRQARAKTFYFQDVVNCLSLDVAPVIGDNVYTFNETVNLISDIDCIYFEFDDVFIVDPIVSAAGKEITSQNVLQVDVPLYANVGYCFRARFNQDEIEFSYNNSSHCSTDISIIEVLKATGEA